MLCTADKITQMGLGASTLTSIRAKMPENVRLAGWLRRCDLFQSIERRAQFNVGRPLAIVRLNLCPRHFPVLINNINSRVRNAVAVLPFVCGIAEPVRVDYFLVWIAQERKADLAFAIGRNLVG